MAGIVADAGAQEWPSKPVRIMVINAAGGLPDIVARTLATSLQKAIGQPIVVENRPGFGGNIATSAVAKAAPDGYTLLVTAQSQAINPTLIPNPGFDYEKDIAPVSMLVNSAMILVATPALPANNLPEFIALAKRQPGATSIVVAPIGGPSHLGAELLLQMAGIDLNFIVYKGVAPAIPDLLSGRVQAALPAVASVLPLIRAGKLKVLAVAGSKRSPQLPEVPTAVDAGLPWFDVSGWICLMTTGGTPAAVVHRINGEVRKTMDSPEIRQALLAQGIEAWTTTPEELGIFLKAEGSKWAAVIKKAKVRITY